MREKLRGWIVACAVAIGAGLVLGAGYGAALAQDGGTPPREPFEGQPLPTDKGAYFAGSGACASCHTNMTDESGADVSIDAFWRATMMANAARDPYWLASVRVETLGAPELKDVIEDKCTTCHMPMARTTVAVMDEAPGLLFESGFASPDHPHHALANDGVSCTLCHQIEPEGLGEMASFSGGFTIDTERPADERPAYNRFAGNPDLSAVMQNASGFVPEQSEHITQAALCASCHTLHTPYLDASGAIAGEFPEQTPYFEWLHSQYAESTPCQGCHMPTAEGGVVTSVVGGEPRSPFAKHVFVGGNAYLLSIFRAFGDDLNLTASSEHVEATHARALDQLQNRAASLALENLGYAGSQVTANVVVQNLAGHKLPTGFPSRRAWLHVVIEDAAGNVVFESGGYDEQGRITDDDHDADPARFEPHRKVISQPGEVQIYESVMVDTEGNVTNILLRGSGYIKDNRLLPVGFDKAIAADDIGVDELALEDANFTGGGDRVMYSINVGDAAGPFTIRAELLYQSIGYNWAEKLRAFATDESAAFLAYVDAVPNVPVVVASTSATVGG